MTGPDRDVAAADKSSRSRNLFEIERSGRSTQGRL